MTPEQYCRNKAAPDGSNLYYSTLYHDPHSRRKLHALFAFHQELSEVVYSSSDPGAARVTLYWWFEEIGRLFSGEPRHPVTRELSQLDSADYLSQQDMMGGVATMGKFLDAPDTGAYRDWLERHNATSGNIWKAAGLACGCTNQTRLATLATAGCCYGAFELLYHVRHFARLGLNILPAELLSKHNLDLETIIQPESGDAGTAFFTELFELIQNEMQTCLTNLQGKDTGNLLFAVTMLKILGSLCHEYRSASMPITHTRISLTPLRKLWIAWKTSASAA